MKNNDTQIGRPAVLYRETKANIEAFTSLVGGEVAYATDTGEDGVYDAVGSAWVWGRAGGGGGGSSDGWTAYSTVVPTRTAADDPVYTLQFAGVDLTTGANALYEGMPIKWTQNSIVRYGWICDTPTFSTNTTAKIITRLDGSSTDYDVLDTSTYAISDFYFGLPKQPGLGMPILDSVWTLQTTDANACTKTSPTTSVWYGGTGLSPTGPSLDFPIGAWNFEFGGRVSLTLPSASNAGARLTLSSANNSESNADYTFNAAFSSIVSIGVPCFKTGYIKVTSKTTHYLNVLTGSASASSIVLQGNTMKSVIRIVLAYLK